MFSRGKLRRDTLRIVENGEEDIPDITATEKKTIRRLSIRGKIPSQTQSRSFPEGTEIQRRLRVHWSNHDDKSGPKT